MAMLPLIEEDIPHDTSKKTSLIIHKASPLPAALNRTSDYSLLRICDIRGKRKGHVNDILQA
jgi:hypothetical protein